MSGAAYLGNPGRRNPHDFGMVTALCKRLDCTLVFGTKTTAGPGERQWRNTALAVDPSGVLGEYYKSRPVHFFNDGIAGRSCEPVRTSLGLIGTPICFDCDYTDVMRKMTLRGAELFAVPSFDAQEWSANQHLQHSALFRLRAAENGRWMVVAASSGESQIIDPHGRVHQSLKPMVQGVITGEMGRTIELTFFTRAGWLFPWIAMVVSGAAIVFLWIRGAKNPAVPTSPNLA